MRANLLYRAFTRIGDEKVPDAKTLARLGQAIGPEVIGKLHGRLMELARERGVVQGRKMRVDTTWWRRISTIRPIAVCWEMAHAC